MSVNRELWTSEFTETGHPGWPCPTCRTGSLHLRPDTLAKQETSDSHLDEERGDIDAYKCGSHVSSGAGIRTAVK